MCRDDGKVCVCEENVCDDEAMCLCKEVGKCILATYTGVCTLCRIEYPGARGRVLLYNPVDRRG